MIRTPIVDHYLWRINSIHRFTLRQIEKNRFPKKCECVVCGEGFLCRNIEEYLRRQYYLGPHKDGAIRHVCWRCSLDHKVKLAAGTLYHLISAIPVAERDGNEIYPNEIPVWPKKYMWLPGLGLSDYAGPARLRSRFGRELVIRQKAASPIRNALTHLVGLPAIDTRWALSLLAPETQQVLKRIGRLYKNSCWWSKKGPQRLFDNAQASSWNAQQWKGRNKTSIEFDPADARLIAIRAAHQIVRTGGRVMYLGSPAKRHARLEATRESYNAKHGSYWNTSSLNHRGRVDRFDGQFRVPSETLREQRSLNIPRETIEVRNNMIENLERDFAPDKEPKAA